MGKRPPVARDGQELPAGPQSPVRVLAEVPVLEAVGCTLREGSFLCKSLSEGCPAPTGHPILLPPPGVMTSPCPMMPGTSGRSGREPPPTPPPLSAR